MSAWFYDYFELASDEDLMEKGDVAAPAKIPKLLHLIWVGDDPEPDSFQKHVEQWGALMPHWSIRVWGNKDLCEENFPPAALNLIHASTKGAQKADIMRCFIIKRFGGVYVDADIIPHRSLDACIGECEVVLCHDLEVTWAYIINAFFAAVPEHPLIAMACRIILSAEINTPAIHLTTGPRALGRAAEITPKPETPYRLLPIHSFYRNEGNPARFGTHTYAKMW